MHRVCFYDNGTHRTYRADGFAAAATDTQVRIYFGNSQRPFIRNHMHRLCRTVFGAGTAIGPFRLHDTTVDKEGGNADLQRFLFFYGNRFESFGRTDFRANGTFIVLQ